MAVISKGIAIWQDVVHGTVKTYIDITKMAICMYNDFEMVKVWQENFRHQN